MMCVANIATPQRSSLSAASIPLLITFNAAVNNYFVFLPFEY
jgi:hypothetical protein